MDYLGYIVDAETLRPMPDKVEVITKATLHAKELRFFLSLVGYYRQFIANMSTPTKPLNALLEQGRKWSWTAEYEKAFEVLRNALTSDHLLMHYDPAENGLMLD